MDLISTLLSLMGFATERANRAGDRRVEVARLNAEIAGETGRSLDFLNAAAPVLIRRCQAVYPGNLQMADEYAKALEMQRSQLMQVLSMTTDLSNKIANSRWADWDLALQRAHEMRATATRFYPATEDIIRRLDAAIDADEKMIERRPS